MDYVQRNLNIFCPLGHLTAMYWDPRHPSWEQYTLEDAPFSLIVDAWAEEEFLPCDGIWGGIHCTHQISFRVAVQEAWPFLAVALDLIVLDEIRHLSKEGAATLLRKIASASVPDRAAILLLAAQELAPLP